MGRYKLDVETTAKVPICGLKGAVFWQADMDITCNGKRSSTCNDTTDPGYAWTPIITCDGAHHVNASYYTDVRVPVNRVALHSPFNAAALVTLIETATVVVSCDDPHTFSKKPLDVPW